MAQPEVSAAFLSERLLRDQGLLSRFLITFPKSTMGNRLWREPSETSHQKLKLYNDRLAAMLAAPLPLAVDKRNELTPRPLPLSSEARALLIEYIDSVEVRIGADGDYHRIAGLANKLGEHAARLAGVLTLVEDLNAPEISGETMAGGIMLAEHYAGEALRLHMSGHIDPALADAEKLRVWCLGRPDAKVTIRDICRLGPNSIRDAATARALVAILVDHRWLTRLEGGTRREIYRVYGHGL